MLPWCGDLSWRRPTLQFGLFVCLLLVPSTDCLTWLNSSASVCNVNSIDMSDGNRAELYCSTEELILELTVEKISVPGKVEIHCNNGTDESLYIYEDGNRTFSPGKNVSLSNNEVIPPGSVCRIECVLDINGEDRYYDHSDTECMVQAHPPSVTPEADVFLIEGGQEPLNLTCINNNYSPNVSQAWWDSEGILSTNEMYTVENVTREDAGVYKCVLTGVNNYTVERSVTVEVQYLELYASSEQRTLVGDDLNLTCVYSGVPRPPSRIQWFHNGSNLTNNTAIIIEDFEDGQRFILSLENVTLEDGGDYTCQAENEIGISSVTMPVTIFEPTEMMTTQPSTTQFVTTDDEKNILVIILAILIPLIIMIALAAIFISVVQAMRKHQSRKYERYHSVVQIHNKFHDEFDNRFEPGINLDKLPKSITTSRETLIVCRSFSKESLKVDKQDNCSLRSSNSLVLDHNMIYTTTAYPSESSGYQEGDFKSDLSLGTPVSDVNIDLSQPLTEPAGHVMKEAVQMSESIQLDDIKHGEEQNKEKVNEMGDLSQQTLQPSVESIDTVTAGLIESFNDTSALATKDTKDGNNLSTAPSTSSSGYIQNTFHYQNQSDSGYIVGGEQTSLTHPQSNGQDFSLDILAHDTVNVHVLPQPIMEDHSQNLNTSTVSTNGYVQEQQSYNGLESQHVKCLDQTDTSGSSAGYITEHSFIPAPLEGNTISTRDDHIDTITAHPLTHQTLNLDREQSLPDGQDLGASPISSSYSSYITVPEVEQPSNRNKSLDVNTSSQDTPDDECVHDLDFFEEATVSPVGFPVLAVKDMIEERQGNQQELLSDGYVHENQTTSETSSQPLSWFKNSSDYVVDSNSSQEGLGSVKFTLPDFTTTPNMETTIGDTKNNTSVHFEVHDSHIHDELNPASISEETYLDEVPSPLSVPVATTSESSYVQIPDVQCNNASWSQEAQKFHSNYSSSSEVDLFQEDVLLTQPQSLQHTMGVGNTSDGYVVHNLQQ